MRSFRFPVLIRNPEFGCLLAMIFLQCMSIAQVKQDWAARYDSRKGHDELAWGGKCIGVDSVGYITITGHTPPGGPGGDYLTLRLEPTGKLQWLKPYNSGLDGGFGARGAGAQALAVVQSGNVYVTGHSYEGHTFYDYVTIKYDVAGNRL